ncbi:DUF4145 domain-containing protein [Streptomyces sp. NBC_01230]|uniref:DUF4145 domain-containing protein n=1 Tax=unclassified Streptomyces TaxID=2593676 RepID=UPI002E15D960|nr:DUF4145 domain-containing protein [Streptomyces sp. NBC_01230]
MTLVFEPYQLPETAWDISGHQQSGDHPVYMAAFRCSNERCVRLTIGWKSVFRPPTPQAARDELLKATLQWTPSKILRPSFPDVPEQIAATASEAHACLSIQAYRGAVALARAVVEATAKEKDITGGPLVANVDRLHQEGHIREITRQLAYEIREGGNEIAHGDLGGEPMPPEDAEAIVSLMDEILLEV